MIVITAVMKAKEGKSEDMAKELKKYPPKYQKDPGCINYQIFQRMDNPNVFFVFEQYKDNEAVQFHMAAPHFTEMMEVIKPYADSGAEVALYKEL